MPEIAAAGATVRSWWTDRLARAARPTRLKQAAAFAVPGAIVLFAFGGGSDAAPHCAAAEVKPTIVSLFKRQLKLTPYARFIDVAQADVNIEAIFAVSDSEPAAATTKSCVAFATYEAKFNEAGRNVVGREHLQHSLLDELSGEKQVFFTVKRTAEGRSAVRVTRISG